jgi:hypothetical protein
MLEALAWAARRARREAGASRWQIAALANVAERTVSRFEQRRAWPADPENLIDAYARCAELHPREIWQAAVNAWSNSQ